jgi:hypothetical protein
MNVPWSLAASSTICSWADAWVQARRLDSSAKARMVLRKRLAMKRTPDNNLF